jgi:hypothetical protein
MSDTTTMKTAHMTVSMDGLRRSLARAYSETVEGFREVVESRDIEEFSKLKEGLDDMRRMIGALMCVFSEDPEDRMTDMVDEADKLPWASPDEAAS